jgi:uncharacterized membrane protein
LKALIIATNLQNHAAKMANFKHFFTEGAKLAFGGIIYTVTFAKNNRKLCFGL